MIIGSTALKKHFPDLNRIPKDIDLIKDGYPFDKEYKDIYDFIYSFEDENKNPFNLELIANNDNVNRDSYGYENSQLERIFYDRGLDIHIGFYGTRQSFNGEEWESYQEVEPTEKIIQVYKKV